MLTDCWILRYVVTILYSYLNIVLLLKRKEKQCILHIWNQYITTIDDLKEPLKLPVKINNSQSHYPEISY